MKRIRKEVEEKFKELKETRKSLELKEEIILDLEEKYSDLIKEGKDEIAAYELTISGLSNIEEITNILKEETLEPLDKEYIRKANKKTALVVSSSVFLYIIAIIAIIILDELGMKDYIIISSFLTLVALPTCILIYHFMSKDNYQKEDSTITEEFKEWKHKKSKNENLTKSIQSLIWTVTIIIYLLLSFNSNSWYISWIIFLIGGAVSQIIKIIMGE